MIDDEEVSRIARLSGQTYQEVKKQMEQGQSQLERWILKK